MLSTPAPAVSVGGAARNLIFQSINGTFSYHLRAVSSRSHKVLLSFVKKLRQEIYGNSDWPLKGFITILGRTPRQVTIGLYARCAMALQHQRLIGWCHSHPFGLSHRCALRSDRPTQPGSHLAARSALYVCHHRLANSHRLRCMPCPDHELGGDALSLARLRRQGRCGSTQNDVQ
jgi:hypothetical protein